MDHILARDAGKPDFNEEELKLFGSYERKVKDYLIVMIMEIDSLKKEMD